MCQKYTFCENADIMRYFISVHETWEKNVTWYVYIFGPVSQVDALELTGGIRPKLAPVESIQIEP